MSRSTSIATWPAATRLKHPHRGGNGAARRSADPSASVARRGHGVSFSLAILSLLVATAAGADPYPPNWSGGSGPAVHFPPVAWPANDGNGALVFGDWATYTVIGNDSEDQKVQDPSNGGTSPQGYVNVSSGCTDLTLPSIFWTYDPTGQVLFFRWRVEQIAHTYATGPAAGTYGSTDPWKSALWTVFIDIDGDGNREFAMHIDGSSGGPGVEIDRLASIYSNAPGQSINYVEDPRVCLLAHNPTAFVDGPSDGNTGRILNFHNSLSPTPSWPNGAAEALWDYGTTRARKIDHGTCVEYFVDYQIPLAMLDATSSACGGPAITPDTPIALSFATANSLNNPLQKDVIFQGDFIGDPNGPIPFGDVITPNGGQPQQPTVLSLTANGCGPATLQATVLDALAVSAGTVVDTIASVDFYSYADTNGNGIADDGNSWTFAVAGSPTATIGQWTASWNTTSLPSGAYLIGLRVQDDQGNVTWSHLTQAEVNSLIGATPPNYPNLTPLPGVVATPFVNTCGTSPSLVKTASASSVSVGGTVDFTLTLSADTLQALTVSSITDTLPPGWSFVSNQGGTLTPVTSPAPGATGNVTWTFAPDTVPAAGSRTLVFRAQAPLSTGSFINEASAATSRGTLASNRLPIDVGAPRLTIAKSVSAGSAAPGASLTYTITYSNDSPINVTNAVITDTLPTGLTFVSATGGGVHDGGSPGTVTWNVGDLDAGEGPFSVTFTATVDSPLPPGTANPIVNTATITSDQTSPASDPASTFINLPLVIQKRAGVGQVAPGTNVVYTIDFANTGTSSLATSTITDVVPTGFTFQAFACGSVTAPGSCATTSAPAVGGTGTVTWTISNLPAGGSGTVTLTLRPNNPFTGANPTPNTATYSSPGLTSVTDTHNIGVTTLPATCPTSTYYFRNIQQNVGNHGTRYIANTTVPTSTTTTTLPNPAADLPNVFTEMARFYSDPVQPFVATHDGNVTATIYFNKSNGPQGEVRIRAFDYNPTTGATSQIGAAVADTINGNGDFVGNFNFAATGILPAGHRILWIVEGRSKNANNNITMVVQFDSTTRPSNGTICLSPLTQTVDKSVSPIFGIAGTALTYTVRFANTGRANVTGAQITDTLPDGVTFVSATLNGVAATPTSISGQTYTFAVRTSDNPVMGTLTAGLSGTLTINATVNNPFNGSSTTQINNVTLTSAEADPASASATTLVTVPNVAVEKAASDTLVQPGDTVTYTLTVSNFGNAQATNVVVTDVLPVAAYYTYDGNCSVNTTNAPGTVANCSFSSPNLTVNATPLGIGRSFLVTYSMTVQPGAPAGLTERQNTAQVYDDSNGPGSPRSSNTVIVTISTNPNLQIDKSTTSTSPLATGEVVTYTLAVSNTGSASADGVEVMDVIPPFTTYVPGSLVYEGGARTDATDADNAQFVAVDDEVVFDVGSVGPGVTRTMTFQVVVDSVLPAGTSSIPNTAVTTSTNAGQRSDTVTLTADAAPLWDLFKDAPASRPFPLAVLPGNLPGGGTTSIPVDDASLIAVGDEITISSALTTATVTAITGNTLTVDTALTGAAGNQVWPVLEFTLRYRNDGDADATGVVLTDDLPANTTFVSASGGGVHDGLTPGSVTWTLGTVTAGDEQILTLLVRPNQAGTYTNDFVVASNEVADATSNTTTTQLGVLEPAKTTSTPNVTNSPSGTTASYALTVTNASATQATNVSVTDTFSTGFTFSSTTSTSGGTRTSTVNPTVGDNPATWCCWTLNAGATLTINLVAAISDQVGDGTYHNSVATSSNQVAALSFDETATTAEDVTVDYVGPNHVVVSWFEAYRDGGDVVLRWETSAEVETAGFRVLRRDAAGAYRPVHAGILQGLLTEPQGGVYSLVDEGVPPGGEASYLLVEVETNGRERSYGPLHVRVAPSREDLGLADGLAERKRGDLYAAKAHLRRPDPASDRAAVAEKAQGAAPSGVRVAIAEEGWYRLTAAEVAGVIGLTPAQVRKQVLHGRVNLSLAGEAVSWVDPTGAGDEIRFFAEGPDSLFSAHRVYLLAIGKGRTIAAADATPGAPVPGQTFRDTRHFELETRPLVTGAGLDPEAEMWFWDFLIGGQAAKPYDLALEGVVAGGADATLRVALQGASATGSQRHRVQVTLNDQALGAVELASFERRVTAFTVPASLLREGANRVTLRAESRPGVSFSLVFLDEFDVDYTREYRTTKKALAVRNAGYPTITVNGLPEAGTTVLDVTQPRTPRALSGVVHGGAVPAVSVRFAASGTRRYFVVTPGGVKAPAALAPDYASSLFHPANAADYLVIAPTALQASAERLADLRRARGLEAMVVTVDDVMDETNGSQLDPRALREFLARVAAEWRRAPRYVALVGEGHYDYRNVWNVGANPLPPLLVAGSWGLYASDNRIADLDDDGLPDVAIGRIPAVTAAQLDAYVDKLATWEAAVEGGAAWSDRVMLLADNPDATGDYIVDSDRLAGLLAPAAVADRVYLGPLSTTAAFDRLVAGLDAGVGLVTYLGHAGITELAHEGLLRSSDVSRLTNADHPPVMALMACHLGNFALPGFPSLAEDLVLDADGGAAAVWTPAGISYNPHRRALAELFLARLSAGDAVLGDAVLATLRGGGAALGPAGREIVESQVLLGDPATLVGRPASAQP